MIPHNNLPPSMLYCSYSPAYEEVYEPSYDIVFVFVDEDEDNDDLDHFYDLPIAPFDFDA